MSPQELAPCKLIGPNQDVPCVRHWECGPSHSSCCKLDWAACNSTHCCATLIRELAGGEKLLVLRPSLIWGDADVRCAGMPSHGVQTLRISATLAWDTFIHLQSKDVDTATGRVLTATVLASERPVAQLRSIFRLVRFLKRC